MHTHTCPILFSFTVDDFGVKYVGKEHAKNLITAIREFYLVFEDWNGRLYCVITLKWDYQKHTVGISITGYVASDMHKYKHTEA